MNNTSKKIWRGPFLARAALWVAFVFSSAAAIVPPSSWAAETLDWNACVASASAHHPDIRAARESVRAAEAEVTSSRADYLPGVDGSSAYSRTHGGTAKDNYSYGVSASQKIYPGLSDRPEVAKARAALASAIADLAATAAAVRLDLKTSFTELIYAQDNLALAKKISSRRKENTALVQARFDAGREHKGSLARSRAQEEQSDFDFRQARRSQRVSQTRLRRAMGGAESASGPIVVRGVLDVALPAEPADLSALADSTPEVQSARADLDASRHGLTITRRSFGPTVTAGASASRRGGAWPPRSNSGDWTGNFTMSVPLFSGGKEKSDIVSAGASMARLDASLKGTRDQTIVDIDDRWASFTDAVENVSVRRSFLDAAVLRAEIAQAQYTSGLMSFDDWDIIENDLIVQQKSALSARRDAVLSSARWERTIGRGLDK